MDKKPEKFDRFVRIGETTWPSRISAKDFAWTLTYTEKEITREDRLFLASVISAYSALIEGTISYRNHYCKKLKHQ